MDPITLTAIISGGVGVVTAFITFLGVRSTTKKDIFVTDRQQLSQEQQQFRVEMREEMTTLRAEVRTWRDRYLELEDDIEQLRLTNLKLSMEVEQWKEKYAALLVENETLTGRVSELEGQLNRRRREDRT